MLGGHKWNFYSRSETGYNPDIPTSFSSLSEARDALDYLYYDCGHSMLGQAKRDDPGFFAIFEAWRRKYSDLLRRWSMAFDAFLELHGDTLKCKEREGVTVLQIQKVSAYITLHVERSTADDQTLWDIYCPLFEEMVTLAESIVKPTTHSGHRSPDRKLSISLDKGIIGPLYEVVSRCRHPAIRRKAISLLRSASRQEGVWNALLTAKVAERVVEIEEEGLLDVTDCSDVPDWARISDVVPTFDHVGKRGILRYSRVGSAHEMVRSTKEEILEW